MYSIVKNLVENNYCFRRGKVKEENRLVYNSSLNILSQINDEENCPKWMATREEYYLINAIHALKDLIGERLKTNSSTFDEDLEVYMYYISSFILAKEYSRFNDVEWINSNNKNLIRVIHKLQPGLTSKNAYNRLISKLTVFYVVNNFQIDIEVPDIDFDKEDFSILSEANFATEFLLPILNCYIVKKNSEILKHLPKEIGECLEVFKAAISFKNCESIEQDEILDYVVKFSKLNMDDKERLLNAITFQNLVASGSYRGKSSKKCFHIEYGQGLDLIDAFLTSSNVVRDLRVDVNLEEIKKSVEQRPLLVIRPHMLAGKSNFFDLEYLTACIESTIKLAADRTVVFIVNDPTQFHSLKAPNLFILSFDDLASNDFYEVTRRYEHLSTNHLEFELFSICSYFLIEKLISLLEVEYFHIIEGDTLLLRNISEFDSDLPPIYLSNFKTCCFAKLDKKLISHYCLVAKEMYMNENILDSLRSDYRKRLEMNHSGGFNDMTIWHIIQNDSYGLGVKEAWGRCDIAINNSICDHFYHLNDRKYLESRSLPLDIVSTHHEISTDGEIKEFQGKLIKCIKKDGSLKLYYVSNNDTDVRVNTVQFGGSYKTVMVYIWNKIKSAPEGVSYV